MKEGRADVRVEGSGVWSRRKDMLGRRRVMWALGKRERCLCSSHSSQKAMTWEERVRKGVVGWGIEGLEKRIG